MHAHILTINVIRHFVEMHALIAYVCIFLGVILEGEIVVILAGIFGHLGSLNVPLAFCAVILGGVTKSVIGYSFGAMLQRRHSKRVFVQRVESRITYFLPRFKTRPFWSIFASRFFLLGLHWFSVVFSGFMSVDKKMFIKAELSSLLVWAVAVLSLGYVFSFTALAISHDIRKFLGLLLLFFIAFFIVEKMVAFILEVVSGNYRAKE